MEKILVLGGARSGKSALAERWVTELPDAGPVTYVATAGDRPGDDEWAERVRRHRARRPASWRTLEETDVAAVLRTAEGTLVVDCLSLWLTAVLDGTGAWEDAGALVRVDAAVDELIDAWRSSRARIVAVSNEVGSGIVPATPSGRLFRDLLGTVNQRVAADAHRVVLCVAGRALELPAATPIPPASTSADLMPPSAAESSSVTLRCSTTLGRASRHAPSQTMEGHPGVPAPVDAEAERAARERVDGLAKPVGSLGRLEEIGVWLAARQGSPVLRPPARVGVTVIAGDHGIAELTSAYPAAVTPAMVRTVAAGKAAINALASEHGAFVRVRDLGVDADLGDVAPEVTEHKVSRGTGRIDVEDALPREQVRAAIAAGRTLAGDLSADLLIVGDLGIGNTTIAAALIGSITGIDAEKATGRGTGIDDATLHRKTEIVARAIERARPVRDEPEDLLARIGGADLAAMAGFLAGAAERGVPVLLDGVVVTAAALVAEAITPGSSTWWLAGHRSVEPAHDAALDHLGLEPIVDLRMRLGEGTGALAALPVLRSAVAICSRMAALADLDLG
ncbi:nicotinate-nucleotide--dimethylbenzimidazole phosphoribosyltransferase [Phytoactinopolyspora alkaliphila]|uniref:Nicotinate-nucleotide--dimethylbenzimidazole phosphoribosyltransferase n=1 Tax=Phytoactinopolyspora alkaliphila TaxID=1783498 RepID=A0A6N9YL41_9ACTN|nr:nicotinate-nucleotide--dimethylbenzimidazole phosphoribosyltransferase [Phytoactinopolyspora alkaliphila]NED95568.1 nicotinate-nucleotide--dimethylbenzimidazole phosphoribosyltransferase [Phytoactinopolyspora alkaliphila]